MRGLCGDGGDELRVLAAEVRNFLFAFFSGLPGRTVELAGAHEVQTQGAQDLERGVQLVFEADEEHVMEAPVVRDAEELGFERGGQGRRHRCGALRPLAGKRQLQGQPGRQGLERRLLALDLCVVAPYPLLELHELFRQLDSGGQLFLVQERGGLGLGQGLEEALLFRGVFVEELYRVRELRVLGLHRGKARAFAAAERWKRLLGELGRLAHLDAAQEQQLPQQRLPVRGHGQQPELFHLNDCHISRSLPFPR